MKIKILFSLLIQFTVVYPRTNAAEQVGQAFQSQFTLQSVTTQQGKLIDDWIENNQALVINLSTENPSISQQQARINVEKFRVMLGDVDISSLFEGGRSALIFKGGLPLPSGENELILYQLYDGDWIQVGTSNLSVLTSAGFKESDWQKSLDVSINSQLDEQVSGDASSSQRPTFSDVTSNIRLGSHHSNDDYSIDTQLNLLSVSNRNQAVQFGVKQNDASKLDVTDYVATYQNGNHQVQIGHTSYGDNSLLIQDLSRRGIRWQYQNSNDVEFSGAILSGSDVVGYNNFFGLADYSEQYVNAIGFGYKAFRDSRISLQINANYMDARRSSQNDFGIGEVASAETNQGAGLHILASDTEGRFNGDLTVAMSRYNNPDDFNLSFGDELVALDVTTNYAHNLNMSYQLTQNQELPWGSMANISLNINHSSADPLYQTLTSFVQANVENKSIGAQYQFGSVSGQLRKSSSRDNLDNLDNLLTTKTKVTSFNASLPLEQIFSSIDSQSEPSKLLPNANYSYQETHQYAITSPDFNVSGFNGGSHLPDQLTTNHNLSANWQFDTVSVSIQSSYTDQDNRQVGRELSDFSSLNNQLSLNWQTGASSWSFSLGKNKQRDKENSKSQFSKSANISYSWQSEDGLGLTINYGLSKDNDSLDEASSTSTNADIGLVKNLIDGQWWFPANGSMSFRINYSDSKSIDNLFDFANHFGTKTAQLNINLSF